MNFLDGHVNQAPIAKRIGLRRYFRGASAR
jgi:hypothetical protein